ncbi:MAG: xanthine dehydrogenase family protein molybdopterin-binding subunit [Candidatus Rokubacteria bacterium]|nr:xanthine dehydrogenase family protein molybdopterin-binding subunit [Candidatus Rokubacteria bacterium]
MTGRAVQEAAEDVRDQLLHVASRRLGLPAARLRLEDGAVVGASERLAYPDVLTERFGMSGGELIGRGVVAPGRSAAPLGGSTPFWEMAVGAAEIVVDEETGAITVEQYVSVADVGRCINPRQCEAQDEGAVMQGLGHTLLEEMLYERGQLLNANLVDYRVPRAEDLPRSLECRFVENGDGAGPFGAKGAGEGSLVPVSPAVGNALSRLTGVRLRELPLTRSGCGARSAPAEPGADRRSAGEENPVEGLGVGVAVGPAKRRAAGAHASLHRREVGELAPMARDRAELEVHRL